MFLRNARSSPVIAEPIRLTVTIPMTIPSVVNTDRILLARIAPEEMPKPSLNSLHRFMPRNVSLSTGDGRQFSLHRRAAALALFVARDQPVADPDDPARMPGDIFLVSHHDQCVALAREFLKQREDLVAR